MRRLFISLTGLSLLSAALGCIHMGTCDCDDNLGCGCCGITSGTLHPAPKAEPAKEMPKPEKKAQELSEPPKIEAAAEDAAQSN